MSWKNKTHDMFCKCAWCEIIKPFIGYLSVVGFPILFVYLAVTSFINHQTQIDICKAHINHEIKAGHIESAEVGTLMKACLKQQKE